MPEPGDLSGADPGALFITNLIDVAWSNNAQGLHGDAVMYPVLYRQHLYDERRGRQLASTASRPSSATPSGSGCGGARTTSP